MDTQHLKIFIEVVKQGSFAAAARRLQLPPPQITRAIAGLEGELGARLLHRTTRRVSLTDPGAAFLERISVVVDELDAAADELRVSATDISGRVRISASVALGQAMIVPLLGAFHERYPRIELDLQLSDRVVDLRDQHIDIAFRQSHSIDESLVGFQLGQLCYRLCASPGYVAKHGAPERPSDLADHDCLRIALRGFGSEWSFRLRGASDASIETVSVGGWLTSSSALALRQAAIDGAGPVMLANWLLDSEIRAGRLVELLPAYDATSTHFDLGVWLLYASRQHLPRRVRVVVDFLRTQLQSQIAG